MGYHFIPWRHKSGATVAICKFPPMARDIAPQKRGIDHPEGQKNGKKIFLDFLIFFHRIVKINVLTYD